MTVLSQQLTHQSQVNSAELCHGLISTEHLKVRTNADTPADAKKAKELGAEGIGLCRTEHMFFEEQQN